MMEASCTQNTRKTHAIGREEKGERNLLFCDRHAYHNYIVTRSNERTRIISLYQKHSRGGPIKFLRVESV